MFCMMWISWISLDIWATELDTSLSSSTCQPSSINKWSSGNRARYGFIEVDISDQFSDQFSFLGNRARYEFIELDMSTGLDLSIPSSRPLTLPGGQSRNGYRAR